MSQDRSAGEDLAYRRFQTDLVVVFNRLHHQIQRYSAQLLEAAGIEGVTPAGAIALIVLFNARGPINARTLADELNVTEVTVSRLLRKLEERGWIERTPDPADGRAMLLRLTATARQDFPQLVQVSNHVLDDVFGVLGREDSEKLAELVQRVQAAIVRASAANTDAVASK